MHDNGLEIAVSEIGTPTIRLRGEVDYHNADKIRETATRLLGDADSLIIDVHNLEFIDSSGLSALLDAAKAAKAVGGEVRLQSPAPQLIHVLTISGFADYFAIPPSGRAKSVPARTVEPISEEWRVTQFEIPPKTELISEARNRVATFAGNVAFSKQQIEDIKLAVGEASSNALRYGCPGARDNIVVRCAHNGRTLRVHIRDNGPCFDLKKIPAPTVESLNEGGRGIYFMRALMDEVNFHFTHSGTTVELVKYLE